MIYQGLPVEIVNAGLQQLHQYLHTYIQPLLRAGKPLDLKDILYHVILSGNLSWFSN